MVKVIYLESWDDFASTLKSELAGIGFHGHVVVRNFDLITAELDDQLIQTGEVNRFDLVLCTGTDRSGTSHFWNAPDFDYDHELNSVGKEPADIIYAYTVDCSKTPFAIVHNGKREYFDLTSGLDDHNGITIYNPSALQRVSKNEYWFKSDPNTAIILVFRLVVHEA